MAGTVKVTIRDGWAVFHDGEQHGGGTVIEVDNETAEYWIAGGWVSPGEEQAGSQAQGHAAGMRSPGRQRHPLRSLHGGWRNPIQRRAGGLSGVRSRRTRAAFGRWAARPRPASLHQSAALLRHPAVPDQRDLRLGQLPAAPLQDT